MRRALLLLVMLALVATSSIADAQRSGGRIGGSSSIGRSSSSRGSSSSSYRHRRSRAQKTKSSSYSYQVGPSDMDRWVAARTRLGRRDLDAAEARAITRDRTVYGAQAFGAGVKGFVVTFLLVFAAGLGVRTQIVYVGRFSVAIGPGARRWVQQKLAQLAADANPSSSHGRSEALGRVCDILLPSIGHASHGLVKPDREFQQVALMRLGRIATELRTRYRHEIIDNRRRSAAPDVQAHPDEGDGYVVVSLVLCCRKRLPDAPDRFGRDELGAALGAIRTPMSAVHGIEIIWSPTEDADRLSSAELEALYPELSRLDGIADVGRVACAYCRTVYAAELAACPACGARIDHGQQSSSPPHS